jgi:hypothetical protein
VSAFDVYPISKRGMHIVQFRGYINSAGGGNSIAHVRCVKSPFSMSSHISSRNGLLLSSLLDGSLRGGRDESALGLRPHVCARLPIGPPWRFASMVQKVGTGSVTRQCISDDHMAAAKSEPQYHGAG